MRSCSRFAAGSALLTLTLLAPGCSEKRERSDAGIDGENDPSLGADGGAGNGGNGGTVDPTAPAAPGVLPTYTPKFPGAGQSGDDAPLTNGMLCDYVPANGAPSPEDITVCFFGDGNPVPAATLEQVLECVDGADVVHVRLTFNPNFVDNTYGTGAIGWPGRRGHTFADLYRSDHAEVVMLDASGEKALQFKIDYLTKDDNQPSGYGTLGVAGGDGNVSLGDEAWILATSTSMHKNLNERGYESYIVDSPATDANYTPNPATPDWDYRMVFEAWVDVAAFGAGGFGGATIEYVHASPAKQENDTIEVTPGKCPPENCVDGLDERCNGGGNPPPGDAGCVDGIDEFCNGGGNPPPGDAGCVDGIDEFCVGGQPVPPPPPVPDAGAPF